MEEVYREGRDGEEEEEENLDTLAWKLSPS